MTGIAHPQGLAATTDIPDVEAILFEAYTDEDYGLGSVIKGLAYTPVLGMFHDGTENQRVNDEDPCLVYRINGGAQNPSLPVRSELVDVWCRGGRSPVAGGGAVGGGDATFFRAKQVYFLLVDRMKALAETVNSGRIVSSTEVVSGTPLDDPDFGNVWFSTWQVQAV